MRSKRAFDILAAWLAWMLFSPLFIILIVFIKLDSPGPVFFIQERMGRGLKSFRFFKFRSMTVVDDSEKCQFNAGDDSRVTWVGQLLRKTKLDELPQLYNVINGDMSIIGPRPEVPKYVNLYLDDFRTILSVRPGLSDFASIKYRSEEAILACQKDPEECYRAIILPDKIKLAKNYVEHVKLRTDLAIIFLTLKRIIIKDAVSI